MSDNYRLLLLEAARLYEKHEAGRPEPFDEPALRESVAQYLHLIAKLTGTDYKEAYMTDLKELCLKDNNLVLVHDLQEAMVEARVSLLHKLWQEIACKLKEEITDPSRPLRRRIRTSPKRGSGVLSRKTPDTTAYGISLAIMPFSALRLEILFTSASYAQKKKAKTSTAGSRKYLRKFPGKAIATNHGLGIEMPLI